MLYFILLNLFHDNNSFEFCIVIINYRSINKRAFIRNRNRKDWPVTLSNSISNHHSFETKSSWLINYLGKKFEDEFLSVAIELGYPIYLREWMKLVLLLCGKYQMLQQTHKELLFVIYQIF